MTATVMAVRVATGFSDRRDFRAVYEVARTAAATMMDTKTAKPPKPNSCGSNLFPHRSFTSIVETWFGLMLSLRTWCSEFSTDKTVV